MGDWESSLGFGALSTLSGEDKVELSRRLCEDLCNGRLHFHDGTLSLAAQSQILATSASEDSKLLAAAPNNDAVPEAALPPASVSTKAAVSTSVPPLAVRGIRV